MFASLPKIWLSHLYTAFSYCNYVIPFCYSWWDWMYFILNSEIFAWISLRSCRVHYLGIAYKIRIIWSISDFNDCFIHIFVCLLIDMLIKSKGCTLKYQSSDVLWSKNWEYENVPFCWGKLLQILHSTYQCPH